MFEVEYPHLLLIFRNKNFTLAKISPDMVCNSVGFLTICTAMKRMYTYLRRHTFNKIIFKLEGSLSE